MKFEDLLSEYLVEQRNDPNEVNGEDDGFLAPELPPDDALEPDEPEEPEEPETPEHKVPQAQPSPGTTPAPKREKPLTPAQIVKIKWKKENPELDDITADGVIRFFNQKKNGLRGLSNDPRIRNLPEVFAMKQRFPDFPAEDTQKIRDIQTYSWEEMEYFLDRYGEAQARYEADFKITGDNDAQRKESAYSKWGAKHNRIIDENGTIVFRVEGKDEAQSLGLIQSILTVKYTGNPWCISKLDSGNLYSNYRSERSYYYVMDTNRGESDPYFVSVLQPADPKKYPGRKDIYVVESRLNSGSGMHNAKTWEQVLDIWPRLRGKENLIKFFGPTPKEKEDITYDKLTFRFPSEEEANNPSVLRYTSKDVNDFARQKVSIQAGYIDSPNRQLSSPRAFLSMPGQLQTAYVKKTTIDNYRLRFKSAVPDKPFAMINALSKQDFNTLNFILKEQLKFPLGINSIKAVAISDKYWKSFSSIENDAIMLFGRIHSPGIVGILNLDTMEWIKPIGYRKVTKTSPKRKRKTTEFFVFQKYLANDGRYFNGEGDGFYVVLPQVPTSSPLSFRGHFISLEEGDKMINSGEYVDLSD